MIRNAKMFNMGLLLLVTFSVVFFGIFSPIFPGKDGKKVNGLDYSDNLFNELSKGSSYFIDKLKESSKKLEGGKIEYSVDLKKPELAAALSGALTKIGMDATPQETKVKVNGDLGKILGQVLVDSDFMFKNDGARIKEYYGVDEKLVMESWHVALSAIDKNLKKDKKIEESKVVNEVVKKGIEPAFNFYGIKAQDVKENIFIMTGLLVFYVIYTMWYGYGIFYLFDGVGLSMKKSKVKKEV